MDGSCGASGSRFAVMSGRTRDLGRRSTMYTIIRFVFCIVVFAAVFFLCRPARQWFLNLDKRWKLLLFVVCCGFLPLFLLSVSPESYFVNFSSPESAYGYLNGGTYSGIVYGKDSAIADKTTGEGAVTTTLLHGSGTKWRISSARSALTGLRWMRLQDPIGL